MLRQMLKELTAGLGAPEPERHRHSLKQASAALLIEIVRADRDVDPREIASVSAALKSAFTLSDQEIEALLADANTRVDEAVSLFEFTSVLNDALDRTGRVDIVADLWRVAHADGHVDHYEEHFIRRIADLLHVSHADFVRTRYAVAESLAVGSPDRGE